LPFPFPVAAPYPNGPTVATQDRTPGLNTTHTGSLGATARGRHGRLHWNPQQTLPLVQALALPLYWLLGRHLLGLGPVAAILFMLAAPLALHTTLLGLGFVVSWHNQHERRGLHHSRRRDWLIAYAREAAASIREFYWLMPFRADFRMPPPAPPLQPLPIILIHGYACNRGLWLPAARWFAARGYRVSAINLTPLHCDIDDYVPTIAAEIAAVRAASGAARVALIGHSMGGLVARAYLQDCETRAVDAAVAALVTLGTPHCGTHIARIGIGESARQMRFRAPWVTALGPRRRPGDAAVVAICSLQDNIVSRPLEQRLPLPDARTIHVRRQGHMSLAASPRILRIVERVLRRAAARAGMTFP
jgi:pimeloyl-ACP methyl ester carboxylesterase